MGGIFTLCLLYFVEISNDSVRGALGTIVSVGADLGTLMGYALGTYCSYDMTPIVAIILTILFAILFLFFPETPICLLKQNRLLVCSDFCTPISIHSFKNGINHKFNFFTTFSL